MSQSQNRIQTTHVGSLIRPPELLALMEARQEGKPFDDGIFADTLAPFRRGGRPPAGGHRNRHRQRWRVRQNW